MQQLSGQDAMFIHAERNGIPQHVGALQIYDQSTAKDGLVRFKQILHLLEERSSLSPIFHRRLRQVPMGLDQPWWENVEDADIERHVHHIALPKPGDWRQLCILASRLHSRPLDMSRPLWEMWIIEGLDNIRSLPKGCFAVLTKLHHAAMDGVSAVQFLPLLHDPSEKVRDLPHLDIPASEHIGNTQMLGRALRNGFQLPGQMWNFTKSIVPAAVRLYQGRKEQDFSILEDKQRTVFQGKISPHRVCDAVAFDFAEVRAIKNTVAGATVNDAMLCIVSGALRHYLKAKNALPDKNLVSGCPINIRSAEDQATGGNMVGFMTVSLQSIIEDPKQRLEAIHEASMESKSFANALGPRLAMQVTDVLPGNTLSLALRAANATGLSEAAVIFNTVVTNVAGPTEQLYFCGARLVDGICFGPLLPNVGLFHIVYSSVFDKQGTITISFTACREMLPDPAFYADCLRRSFEELRAATLGEKK
jgi:diacylglycerol O-acyltransferase / wax synthase